MKLARADVEGALERVNVPAVARREHLVSN